MAVQNLQKSSQTRLWLVEDRAGPANRPSYQSLGRALGVSWPQGDITPIRVPDPEQYGKFVTVDRIKGQQGLPTMSIEHRLTRDNSFLLEMVRKGCGFDIQIHAGVCEDPRNFNQGWEKIYVLEGAEATSYDTGELGALDGDQDAPILETVPVTGIDWYEVKRIQASEIGATEIVQQIVGIAICDSRQCGECGISSNGCEKFFAVTMSAGGSPGLPAELIYSSNAGSTVGQTTITTIGAAEDPTGVGCVGAYVVVISNESLSYHYALTADILRAAETWTEVGTGFVAAKGPNSMFSMGSTLTWMVGDGGYIYFMSDVTSGVSVQSAGALTVQNLLDIHGSDENNIVAVGASNSVLYTNDGENWSTVTGPAVGAALNAVWVKSATEWFVGTATGLLYYTIDAGATWTLKSFPGSGTGQVRDIQFATPTVGYMAHDLTTPRGRVLRTVDGGNSWYVLPEKAGFSIPSNDQITALAACSEDPNVLFAGGIADNATDGILLKFS